MIVEDNERNLKLLRDVLGAYGYRTIEARSGEEAMALVRSERPALVLMDIQLPGMDGVEALRELRRSGDLRRPGPHAESILRQIGAVAAGPV